MRVAGICSVSGPHMAPRLLGNFLYLTVSFFDIAHSQRAT